MTRRYYIISIDTFLFLALWDIKFQWQVLGKYDVEVLDRSGMVSSSKGKALDEFRKAMH